MLKSRGIIKRVSFLLFASLIIVGFQPLPVSAIYNGVEALGSKYVIQIKIGNSYCSAAPLDKHLVITAAHCLVKNGVAVNPETILVYAPGVDVSKSSTFAKGVYFAYPSTHYNDDAFTEPDDIAFVVIDNPFDLTSFPTLANYEKAQAIINSNTPIKVFGYGITQKGGQKAVIPSVFTAIPISQRRYSSFIGKERTYLNFAADQRGSTCPGDSGGPSISEYQGVIYLVTVHSGSGGPCSSGNSGTMISTVSGEYPQLFSKANDFISTQKPSAVTDVALSNNGTTGSISWKLKDQDIVKTAGFSVLDESSYEVCRVSTDARNCNISVKPGKNAYKVIALGKYLNSEPAQSTFNIDLTPPSNPKIVKLGLSGTATWEPPVNFAAYVDYYTVKNAQGIEVCKTNSNNCSLGLSIGTNKFSIFAHYKEIKSLPLDIAVDLANAQPTIVQSIRAFKTSIEVELSQLTNLGDANPNQIKVVLQDSKNGEELCVVAYPQRSCLVPLTARDYQLSILLRTNLGNTNPGPIYSFSGLQQLRTNESLEARLSLIKSDLRAVAKRNPNYSQDVESLISLSPTIDNNTLIDSALIETINNFEGKSISLISNYVQVATDRASTLTKELVGLADSVIQQIGFAENIINKFEQAQYSQFVRAFSDIAAKNQVKSQELNSLINEPKIDCRDLMFSSSISSQYITLENTCYTLKETMNFVVSAQAGFQDQFSKLKSSNEKVEALKVKVEAELRAKQEAEAKAKADAAKKKSTITCIKGKTVKKVTAVNPKCPKGYKKK